MRMETSTKENGKMTRSMVSLKTIESEYLGRGAYTFSDGDIYDGKWMNDKQHGKFGDD